MSGIKWNPGHPPKNRKGERLLVIARPMGVTHDAASDPNPDIFIGHWLDEGPHGDSNAYVPARISGMRANEARPELDIKYWAEIILPNDVEVRSLTDSDFKG